MKNSCFTIFLVLVSTLLTAQGGILELQGSTTRSMGNSQAAYSGIESLFGNPAGVANLDELNATVFAENRFVGTGILFGGAGIAIPSGLGTFGIGIGHFGIPTYNEQLVTLSYSRLLFENFALSVQGLLYNTSIQEYGNQVNLSANLGFQAFLSESLTIGFYVKNPARIEVVKDQFLPTIFALGGQYKFLDKVSILGSVEKRLGHNLSAQFGVEYAPAEKFFIRLGVHTEPDEFTFGIGFKINEKIGIQAVTAYSQILGVSPGVTFSYFNE